MTGRRVSAFERGSLPAALPAAPWDRTGRRAFIACAAVAGPVSALLAAAAAPLAGIRLAVPDAQQWMLALLVAPLLEELAFRGTLQEWLARRWPRLPAWHGISAANALTSLAFAACHLPQHAPLLAAATLLPSLVFGRLRELHGSLAPSMAMHAWYNACLLAAIASTGGIR